MTATYTPNKTGWNGHEPRHGSRVRYRKGCRCVPCVAAESDYRRQYRQDVKAGRRSPAPVRKAPIPVGPLLEMLPCSQVKLAERCGIPRRTISRAIARGYFTEKMADHLAGTLGKHPTEIWPDWYELCDF